MFWSLVVGAISFGWLYHHTYYYRSKEGESPNIDDIEVGVFPKEYDNLKLEVTWTVLPFILIVWLTYISWAPLDAVWTQAGPGGYHGGECVEGESSNNSIAANGSVVSECYHEIGIEGQQWFWEFDCYGLNVPGQTTYLWMPAVEETSFLMLCAEYCGDNHAYMIAQITVE